MKKIIIKQWNCNCKILKSTDLENKEKVINLISWADIIYEGGGDTKLMISLWRKTGFDKILYDAWNSGKVICGISAGAVCYFNSCNSDYYDENNKLSFQSLSCLNWINIYMTPHYDEVVTRTKGLIINSNNEITLGYSHKTYQFPGGHLENNETLEECLLRKIEEETGIKLIDAKLKPFEKITYYNKNYHETGKNRENDIYYYIIKTDAKFDMNNSRLDESEKEGNYIPKTFPIKNIEQILIDSIPDNPINEVIVEEMLDILKEYNKITNIKND